ncbi:iron-sulfur cluster repair protein YtfE [Natronospirillum operosum]|uniref:Iron-sulfur cluster repair protein YtfE n=2 Tax=Natronospirillum operosum TaxID=2759953 RepID=A0A4Z0W5W0_9GAMM|nr:iron-sulfur cluster repair protein YtfE [Natronospirillum operosum]
MTTATPSLLGTSLGEIATQLAGATRVLRQYKLDFCCGGHVTLEEALASKGLDAEPIVQQLQALTAGSAEQDWQSRPVEELIDHIYQNYHLLHREQLPDLLRMARRVEAVHGDKPGCPVGLADHLQAMAIELESHMQKEEQVLFPMLRQGMTAQAAGPITVMQHEHDDHGESLQHIIELTDDMTPPPHACNTWRALYLGLDGLRNDLMEHIHLENNVLFKGALNA